MKNFIKYTILLVVSFIISFELISLIKPLDNVMNVNAKGYSYRNSNFNEEVYFIGDSYASTNYADTGYPLIFRDYFKSKNWNFIDLSQAGSNLTEHKILLDSLSQIKPKLIIYFYNISDIMSIEKNSIKPKIKNIPINNKKVKEKKNSLLKTINNESQTVLLLKKILHFFSIKLTDRFVPGTPAYLFPIETKKNKALLKDVFDSIEADNILILVNTPFNTGERPKKWEQYKIFKDFDNSTNYQIIQAVDILNDSKYGISWRNAHPNQEAIKIIADTLIKEFEKIK